MRHTFAVVSVIFWIASIVEAWRVDWRIAAALLLFSIANSIDMSLRVDSVRVEMIKRIRREMWQ